MTVYVVVGYGEDQNGTIRVSVNAVFDSEEKANEYCERQRLYWNFIVKNSIKTPYKDAKWQVEEHILNKVEA